MIGRNCCIVNPCRRAGFSLVELLTVVGIIALLISILLPALSRARFEAKKAKAAALIDSIGKGLEMFHNDFGNYPNSSLGGDPINWQDHEFVPTELQNEPLTGAHWLARGMLGHDTLGVDAAGVTMKPSDSAVVNVDQLIKDSGLPTAERKPRYLDGDVFARDTNRNYFFAQPGANKFTPTGRLVLLDEVFESPIIYYRANRRARSPFATGNSGLDAGPGVYTLTDNMTITGSEYGDGSRTSYGWNFKAASPPQVPAAADEPVHRMGYFGAVPADPTSLLADQHPGTFAWYLHSKKSLQDAGVVRPVNPERFILLSAGEDGVFGTEDDVTNFTNPL